MKKAIAAALGILLLGTGTAGLCACGERADTKKPVIDFDMAYELDLGGSLKVEYTATDNVGVVSETVTIKDADGNDVTLQVYDTQTGNFTPLAAGAYSIVVEAEDAAGNLARDIFTVTVSEKTDTDDNKPDPKPDTEKPVITFDSAMTNALIIGNSMEVKYTATDNVGVVSKKVIVKKDKADVTNSVYNAVTGLFTPTEAGTYSIVAEAKDKAGNTATKTYIVAVTAPARYELPSDPNYGFNVSVHDPSVFYDEATKTYYAFGSHFAVASSTDLIHWTQLAWDNQPEKLYGTGKDWKTVLAQGYAHNTACTSTWAPDVEYFNGKYYMYASISSFGSNQSAIVRVEASGVTGPYSNEKVIVKSSTGDAPNCIDPELFYDEDGKLWMVYGSFSDGIYIKELYNSGTNWGLPKENGFGKKLWQGISPPDAAQGGPEGPFIFYNGETDYYYLIVSDGSLSTNYHMRVARSKSPDGPYTDITGADMASAHGKGNKLAGNYQFDGDNGWAALGHNSVIQKDGKYLVVCHARSEENGGVSLGHSVQVRQLYFNEDGWPVLSPNRYAGETLGKMIEEDVAGKYDIILHSTGVSANFIPSSRYTLASGGTVISNSAAAGSWSLSGDHFITITMNGTVYKGVVAPCWNLYRAQGLLCITATSSDGRSLWANGLPEPQSLKDAGVTVISEIDGNATNQTVSAFNTSNGFAVSFNLTEAIPSNSGNGNNDWNAFAVTCGDMTVTLPNLIWNGVANLFPTDDNNKNGNAWNAYLENTCFVTVSVSKTNGIQFYKNGVLTQTYPPTTAIGTKTVSDFVTALLSAVQQDGFTVAGNGLVKAYNVTVTTAVTEAQALAVYANLG